MKPDGTMENVCIIPGSVKLNDEQLEGVVATCVAEAVAGSPQALEELLIQSGILTGMSQASKEMSEKLKGASMMQAFHSQRIMDMLKNCMEKEGLKELMANSQVVKLNDTGGKGQVVITGDVPPDFTRTKTTTEPDKVKIGDALNKGDIFSWAYMAPKKKSLTVEPC